MPSTNGPRCPNHGCELILAPGDKRLTKGAAPCKESGVLFEFTQEVESAEQKHDKFGNVIRTFKVEGPDNG